MIPSETDLLGELANKTLCTPLINQCDLTNTIYFMLSIASLIGIISTIFAVFIYFKRII